ncbi:MAG: DUF2007 domain-containing protein [Gallionella sp.]
MISLSEAIHLSDDLIETLQSTFPGQVDSAPSGAISISNRWQVPLTALYSWRSISGKGTVNNARIRRLTGEEEQLICVFEASSGLEAHMILNLLEQAGIRGRIEGEYLQGGVGELQAMNFVKVLVADEDIVESTKIIRDWESVQPSADSGMHKDGSTTCMRSFITGSVNMDSFILGVAFGAAAIYLLLKLQG